MQTMVPLNMLRLRQVLGFVLNVLSRPINISLVNPANVKLKLHSIVKNAENYDDGSMHLMVRGSHTYVRVRWLWEIQ